VARAVVGRILPGKDADDCSKAAAVQAAHKQFDGL
jgi:hypothetical protein